MIEVEDGGTRTGKISGMEPSIRPVLALSSLVDRISPEKLRVVNLYKLFSAIQQLHPATDEALQQAYVEYRRCQETNPELNQTVMSAIDATSFRRALEVAGCSALLTALYRWVETMNLARWADRKAVRIDEEKLGEYALPLGYAVLQVRYDLDLEEDREKADFPEIYDVLQLFVLRDVPEFDLPNLNSQFNRLTLPLFDPTRTTAESFREECVKILDDHIWEIDRTYESLGYVSSGSKKKSKDDDKKSPSKRKGINAPRQFSKTESDRFARAVWDVLTAETFEKAAGKAAEHDYLIDPDTLRLAVRDVTGPILRPEPQARLSLVDGILYTNSLED